MSKPLERFTNALKKVSQFLEQHLGIVNTHMVHFYTGQEWEKLPMNLQTDLLSLTEKELAGLPSVFLTENSEEASHIPLTLGKIMKEINSYSLESLNALDDLSNLWQYLGIEPLRSMIHFDKFMKVKKTHEVGALCDVIASLASQTKSELIIDLGCGKGALGSMLSLNHRLFVSGIDAAGFNAHAEAGRQTMMQRTFNSELKKNLRTENHENEKPSLQFRRTTQYLSDDFDIQPLIEECCETFQQSFQSSGLVGLHTCGNLAATSMRIFSNSPQIPFLCNVGCCYHLLSEVFHGNNEDTAAGFPMSNYMRSKKFGLGRNARMVSSQPLERYAADNKVFESLAFLSPTPYSFPPLQLQPEVLFYRAVLQVILEERFPSMRTTEFHVGRLRKPLNSFVEYARWALAKLALPLEVR